MRIVFTAIFLIFLSSSSFSQASSVPFTNEYENPVTKKGLVALGFGIGLPYGGVGFRGGYNIADRFTTFAGLGYAFAGVGFNVGAEFDFAVVNRTSFYLSAMGGYNSVTFVDGAPEYKKIFYGPSFGLGIKVDSRKQSGNFLHLSLLYPVRNGDFHDMIDRIKNDPRIDFVTEPWPVLITVGYNMGINPE